MSRRARRRESLTPSMFPFLAVLLCTMGSLVLMLILMVGQSQAALRIENAKRQDSLHEAIDEVDFYASEMTAQYESGQEQIDQQRQALEYFENHIRDILEQARQLQQQFLTLKERQEAIEAETTEQLLRRQEQLEQLQAQIDAKTQEVESLLEARKAKPPAFAIIPYHGGNGTGRRPIYLECTANGVVVQPEGVLLEFDDLKPPFGPGNPLDAVLRMIRNELARANAGANEFKSAYPLLLVRPDGIKAYTRARAAMNNWDDQFGYELVDQDMDLVFPPSLPTIAQLLPETVQTARMRQEALIASLPAAMRRSLENATEANPISLDPANSGSFSAAESYLPPNSQNFGDNWELIDEVAGLEVQPNGSSFGPSRSASSSRDFGSRNESIPGFDSQSNRPDGVPGEELSLDQGSWQVGSSGSPNQMVLGETSSEMSDAPNRDALTFSSSMLEQPGGGKPFADSNEYGAGQGNGLGHSQTPSTDASQAFANNASQNSSPAMGGISSAQGTYGGSSGGSQSATPTSPEEMAALQEEMENASFGYGNRQPVSQPLANNPQNGQPSSETGSIAKRTEKVRPISVSHGQDWGRSRVQGRTFPVIRSIPILAAGDAWYVLLDARSRTMDRIISLESGPTAAGEELAELIYSRVESWGAAGNNGYWQPKLDVWIMPDGQRSALRLEQLMEGSGVEIQFQDKP